MGKLACLLVAWRALPHQRLGCVTYLPWLAVSVRLAKRLCLAFSPPPSSPGCDGPKREEKSETEETVLARAVLTPRSEPLSLFSLHTPQCTVDLYCTSSYDLPHSSPSTPYVDYKFKLTAAFQKALDDQETAVALH